MKWIGQHIYDQISRFRNHTYFEDSITLGSGKSITLDEYTSGTISITKVQDSGTSFQDNNTSLMTAAAIADKIEAYGYSTTVFTTFGITLIPDSITNYAAWGLAGNAKFRILGGEGINTTATDQLDATEVPPYFPAITISGEDASTTNKGIVELATTAETTTGTDAGRVVTPDGLKDGYQGSSNVTTLGTIGTGVWNGDAITTHYIAGEAIGAEHLESGLLNTIEVNTAKTGITSGQASAITANTAKNTSSNVYGSTIKLIPSDFETNGDGGNTKFGAAFDKTAGADDYGMRTSDSAQHVFAFVSIPEGMKATHVEIYGKRAKVVEVFEVQINATTVVSKGTGDCTIPGGDSNVIELSGGGVTSTATNLLAIEVVTTAATADRVYGGAVTIAVI